MDGRPGAGGKVLLVGEAGITEMDVGVHETGEHILPRRIVDLRPVGGHVPAHSGNDAVSDQHVGLVSPPAVY